jgi:uncharacterized protein YkwD
MIHRSFVALAALAALAFAVRADALTVPKLTLVVSRDGEPRLHWVFSGTTRGDHVTIEIQESLDGEPFVPWDSFDRAKRKQTVPLGDLEPGAWAWRARAIDSDETTAWSSVAQLTIEAPPTSEGDPPLAAGQRECPAGWVAKVLALANEARADAGIAPLRDHPLLAKAARTRVIDMEASGRLTHDGWVATIQSTGYTAWTLGENIASGYSSPAHVMSGWLASSGHRANLLRASFRDSGVGCVLDSRGRPWWAHDFGG